MCDCHYDEETGQFVVCDHCASQQIEAKNAQTDQIDLRTFLSVDERDQLASVITDFFAQVKEAAND